MNDRVRQLIDSVRDDPEARGALLAALIPAEITAMPPRLDAIEVTLVRLADAQARTEANLAHLTERVDQLAQRVDQLGERVDQLAEAQRRTEIAVQTLADRFGKQLPRIDTAIGYVVERRYEERASAYFAPIANRIRVLSRSDRDDLVDDALEAGKLTRSEARAIRLADTIARARRGEEVVHLVVEASYTVDEHDVERAVDRAGLLARLVGITIPIVAGEYIDTDAQHAATAGGVYQVLDGTVTGPDGLVLT